MLIVYLIVSNQFHLLPVIGVLKNGKSKTKTNYCLLNVDGSMLNICWFLNKWWISDDE